jgi:hypothetical protein
MVTNRTAACFAGLYNSANEYFIKLYYNTDPKSREASRGYEDSDTSAVPGSVVTKYVGVLKAAGFVFDFAVEHDVAFMERTGSAYVFSTTPHAMSLPMTKFWLNFVRYITKCPECIAAAFQVIEDSGGLGVMTKLDVFNVMCVCGQSPNIRHNNAHNITPVYSKIMPMSKTEFERIEKHNSTSSCSSLVKAVIGCDDVDVGILATKGGYKAYLKAIPESHKKTVAEHEAQLTALKALIRK